MFIGSHYPKLDDKFRLILPAKFRDPLAGGLFITKGQEHCLVVVPIEDYLRRAEKMLAEVTFGTPQYRNLNRQLFHDADKQTPDGQGRILLSQKLRDWASLSRDLVVAGTGNHIEIWNPEAHAAYMAEGAEAFANYSEEVRGN